MHPIEAGEILHEPLLVGVAHRHDVVDVLLLPLGRIPDDLAVGDTTHPAANAQHGIQRTAEAPPYVPAEHELVEVAVEMLLAEPLVPGAVLASTNGTMLAAERSAIRTIRMPPTPCFPWVSTAAAIHIWLAVLLPPPRSNASFFRRKGIADWSTSTVPESGARSGFTMARRSLCRTSQAVL